MEPEEGPMAESTLVDNPDGLAYPELVLFYGPPLSGKTRYYEDTLKESHVRVSAEEIFASQPSMSLHRVVNMALAHMHNGKSVVIDDTNGKRVTRASYIRGLRTRLTMCRVLCIQFKPVGDVLQCKWQNEWARAARACKEGQHVPPAKPAEAWDDWAVETDPPASIEGYDEIKTVECSLRSYNPTPFDTRGLIIDADALFEFDSEKLSDAFFSASLRYETWLSLRDDAAQTLFEYQSTFPQARVLVLFNEADLLPPGAQLLDAPQRSSLCAQFRARLLNELAALPLPLHYLYIFSQSSSVSTFFAPPSPGWIAWIQERHRLSLSDTLLVVRDNSQVAISAKSFLTQISGDQFLASSGWNVPSKIRMYSRAPSSKPGFLDTIELPDHVNVSTTRSPVPVEQDEPEVIDDLLEHGLVKQSGSYQEPSPSDTFDRQPFPSPSPFSMPTIRTTAAPVTPLPQEKMVKEALTPASLRTPTSELSPAPSPGRRRLPGWMSPGGAKICKPRKPKLEPDAEQDGGGPGPAAAPTPRKTSTPKPKAKAVPEKAKKDQTISKMPTVKDEIEDDTEDLLLSVSRMDSDEDEASFPTLASGKRKREQITSPVHDRTALKQEQAEDEIDLLLEREEQAEAVWEGEQEVPSKRTRIDRVLPSSASITPPTAKLLQPSTYGSLDSKSDDDGSLHFADVPWPSPPHTPLGNLSPSTSGSLSSSSFPHAYQPQSSAPSTTSPKQDIPDQRESSNESVIHTPSSSIQRHDRATEAPTPTETPTSLPVTPSKPKVSLRDQLMGFGLLSSKKPAFDL